jgi:hypothetical protein
MQVSCQLLKRFHYQEKSEFTINGPKKRPKTTDKTANTKQFFVMCRQFLYSNLYNNLREPQGILRLSR